MLQKERKYLKIFDLKDLVTFSFFIIPAGGFLYLAHLFPKFNGTKGSWYQTEEVMILVGLILLVVSAVSFGIVFVEYMEYRILPKSVKLVMKQERIVKECKYDIDKAIQLASEKLNAKQYKELHDYANIKFNTNEYRMNK
jgi:hypothetical protein